jgi:hypothetical protein
MRPASSLIPTMVAAGLILSGCASAGSSGPMGTQGPAQQLRDYDIAMQHTAHAQATYNKAFAKLSADCEEQGVPLANEVHTVVEQLQRLDIKNENDLTVMQHLTAAVPAGPTKSSCAAAASVYVRSRKGT